MRFLLLLFLASAAPAVAQTPPASWPRVSPAVFVELSYPPDALKAGVVGRVVAKVTTDAAGRVTDAEAISGPGLLVPPVIANLKQWTLSPGVRGEAIVYRFEIDEGVCNDDSHSFFRVAHPNLVVITACSRRGRVRLQWPAWAETEFASLGARPTYPAIAFNARITGIVVLELFMDGTGAVVDARPLTTAPLLVDAAVAHVKKWKARARGPRRSVIVYEFKQDNHSCDHESSTAFWWVTTDYVRLSACGPLVQP